MPIGADLAPSRLSFVHVENLAPDALATPKCMHYERVRPKLNDGRQGTSQVAEMITWAKWGTLWSVAFAVFLAGHQVGGGFLGPFSVLFCDNDGCGVERFSPLRLFDKMFASTEHLLIRIIGSAFLSSLVCVFLWNASKRSKNQAKLPK